MHSIHHKKRLGMFPSPAGMSLTKLSLDGNNFQQRLTVYRLALLKVMLRLLTNFWSYKFLRTGWWYWWGGLDQSFKAYWVRAAAPQTSPDPNPGDIDACCGLCRFYIFYRWVRYGSFCFCYRMCSLRASNWLPHAHCTLAIGYRIRIVR